MEIAILFLLAWAVIATVGLIFLGAAYRMLRYLALAATYMPIRFTTDGTGLRVSIKDGPWNTLLEGYRYAKHPAYAALRIAEAERQASEPESYEPGEWKDGDIR